jgi:Spy/CpxP family protein refolding chaperone
MISNSGKAKLLVFSVFFVGIVTGALLDHLYETRWKADANANPSQRDVNQVYDILDLSAEQRQQFDAIMQASRPEFQRLWQESRKLLEPNRKKEIELREQTRSKIRAILTEDQRKKYNEFNERLRQRRQGGPDAKQ